MLFDKDKDKKIQNPQNNYQVKSKRKALLNQTLLHEPTTIKKTLLKKQEVQTPSKKEDTKIR